MVFKGYQMTFSTEGNKQYETIGNLWDKFASVYGIENIRGLGFNWSSTTIDYCFGFVEDLSVEEYVERLEVVNTFAEKPFRFNTIELPDENWVNFKGETEKLDVLYDRVYKDGQLDFEIERFDSNGKADIDVHYIKHDEAKIESKYKTLKSAVFFAVMFDIIAAVVVLFFAYWIYFVLHNPDMHISFLTLGVPIIAIIVCWLIQCFFLVNRINKRKDMAKCLIGMRLPEDELMDKARKYHVYPFVSGMLEVQKRANSNKNPL